MQEEKKNVSVRAEQCHLSSAPAANTGSPCKLQPQPGSDGHTEEGLDIKKPKDSEA